MSSRTRKMLEIEAAWDADIVEVIKNFYEQYQTQEAVADQLGITQGTLWSWLVRLGLEEKKILVERVMS